MKYELRNTKIEIRELKYENTKTKVAFLLSTLK